MRREVKDIAGAAGPSLQGKGGAMEVCASSNSASSSSSGASSCCLMVERTTSRLASEYARTSEELVGYVGFLERVVEKAQADKARCQQEALDARNQAALAAHRLTHAHRHAQVLAAHKAQALHTARHSKEQLRLTQALLAEEQQRAKKLEARIDELEEAAKRKHELIEQRKRKERKARKVLERQNESLMKKATLSWILACLSDPYLELESTSGGSKAASLLEMARNLQQETETDQRLVVNRYCGKTRSLRLECEYIENEIRRLLHLSDSPQEEAESIEIPSRTPEPSSARSLDEELSLPTEVGIKDQRSDQRKEKSKGCSPSRIKAADHDDAASPCKTNLGATSGGQAQVEREDTTASKATTKTPGMAVKKKCPQSYSSCAAGGRGQSMKCVADYCLNVGSRKPEDIGACAPAEAENRWARFKVLNRRQAERQEILRCQSDIMKMLRGLKANMGYLLDLEERSLSCKESSTNSQLCTPPLNTGQYYPHRHHNTSKGPKLASTALSWRRRPWQ